MSIKLYRGNSRSDDERDLQDVTRRARSSRFRLKIGRRTIGGFGFVEMATKKKEEAIQH